MVRLLASVSASGVLSNAAMSHSSFLAGIRDDPDDDTARLVYADYLDEEGDPARAEFIRVQIQLARLSEDDDRRSVLEDREHELLAANEERWLGAPMKSAGLIACEFRRGFIDEVSATPGFMLGAGEGLLSNHAVRRWRINSTYNRDASQELLECGRCAWAERLEAVSLVRWNRPRAIGPFLTDSRLQRLRELDLWCARELAPWPEFLTRVPFRATLKALRLAGAEPGGSPGSTGRALRSALAGYSLNELLFALSFLSAEDLRELLSADSFRDLEALAVSSNPIEPNGWDAFQAANCRLRSLDLSSTPLGGISLENVLRCDSTSQLRKLTVNGAGSAMFNIPALTSSPFWGQAEELCMQDGTIPERALEPFFTTPGPSALRLLNLSNNYVRDAGVSWLCGSSWASTLRSLNLSRNYLTDNALSAIGECDRFTRLRTLLVEDDVSAPDRAEHPERITDAGCRALASSPALRNLRELSLSGTDITMSGVEMLFDEPCWNLNHLRLARCPLFTRSQADSLVNLVARSPRLQKLRWLNLSDNLAFSGDALLPLAESEYLSPLLRLDIAQCRVSERVQEAFQQRLYWSLNE